MNWETLLENETKLWNERILKLKEHGDTFTYQELSDIWDMAQSNVTAKINSLVEYDVITKNTSTTPYTIMFHWGEEEEKEEKKEGVPSYIKNKTYDNVLSYLEERGIWGEGCELVFRRGSTWDPLSQRGGLVVVLLVDGLPTLEFKARFDNGLIIKGSGLISTVSSNTIRDYISDEMTQAGHAVIASYFSDE